MAKDRRSIKDLSDGELKDMIRKRANELEEERCELNMFGGSTDALEAYRKGLERFTK